MKELNSKINGLWQSKREEMGKKGNLWMALFLGSFAIFLIVPFCLLGKFIDKILFGYMIVAFSVGAITFVATYLFIYSKKMFDKWLEKTFKVVYKVLLCLCFIGARI